VKCTSIYVSRNISLSLPSVSARRSLTFNERLCDKEVH
jgi:hypothetical protein